MRNPALPLIDLHCQVTFKSRGVAVPFTTPLLAGARLREARRAGVELMVPNPSGSRGIYILNWSAARAFCNPTVHDTVLFQRCSTLTAIEPASVRDAVLKVAHEGHAGREAATAADAAIAHDRSQRLLAHSRLMTGLVEQVNAGGPNMPVLPEFAADSHQRATVALHRISPSLGRPAAYLASGLAALGNMFAPVGVTFADRDARIPRLLVRLEETHTDLSRWLGDDPENEIGGLGEALTVAMRGAAESGAAVLESTRSALTDPAGLLKRWTTNAGSVLTLATRCEWLLDGWERVIRLWLSAHNRASRRAALLEMAPLVHVLPREVIEWTDTSISPDAINLACRVTSHQDAWRSGGSAFALITRNEKLLAMSARGP